MIKPAFFNLDFFIELLPLHLDMYNTVNTMGVLDMHQHYIPLKMSGSYY